MLVSLKGREKSQVVQEPQEAPTTWKSKNNIPELTEKRKRIRIDLFLDLIKFTI